MTLAMSGATEDDAGLASGLVNTTQQVGGALGLAVLATLSTTRTDGLLADGVGTASALTSGYRLAFVLGAGFVAVALVVATTVLRPAPAVAPAGAEVDGRGRRRRAGGPARGRLAARARSADPEADRAPEVPGRRAGPQPVAAGAHDPGVPPGVPGPEGGAVQADAGRRGAAAADAHAHEPDELARRLAAPLRVGEVELHDGRPRRAGPCCARARPPRPGRRRRARA